MLQLVSMSNGVCRAGKGCRRIHDIEPAYVPPPRPPVAAQLAALEEQDPDAAMAMRMMQAEVEAARAEQAAAEAEGAVEGASSTPGSGPMR